MADLRETLFELPIAPEGFGVILPPANLRRIDFSGLDYETARRAVIEYVKTYWSDEFNDFAASNGIIMLSEIVASVVAKLSLRADILANEGFLATAQTEEAVSNHLALINQKIKRQTPAVVELEVSVNNPAYSDIHIAAGAIFSVRGPDARPVYYEAYRAPGDFKSDIIVPANKRGVIAYGIEGRFASVQTVFSSGGPNQVYQIAQVNVLEAPVFLDVYTGQSPESWIVTTQPIERYGPTDKVVEVNFLGDRVIFRFGNNMTGAAPLSGQKLEFRFRLGGGSRGRIGVGALDETRQVSPNPPANAPVSVRFRNVAPSAGGTDRETIEQAKRRAPRDYSLRSGIVTSEDYAQVAKSFAHPAFGAVSKAVATVRTGRNANLIEIHALAEGPDGIPVAPNAGLKAGLKTYYEQLNVLTDSISILDGQLKPVDVEMTIVVNRNMDASVVKTRVEQTITDFFQVDRWEMGQALYTSQLLGLIQEIDGVKNVDMFQPADNIISVDPVAETGTQPTDGISYNELIVEGKRTTRYYYEKGAR